jgi:hypothetical protein
MILFAVGTDVAGRRYGLSGDRAAIGNVHRPDSDLGGKCGKSERTRQGSFDRHDPMLQASNATVSYTNTDSSEDDGPQRTFNRSPSNPRQGHPLNCLHS